MGAGMVRAGARVALLLCAALLAAARTPAEEPARLERWPAIADRARLETEIARLRKPRTPEMAELGRAGLVELGSGVVPELLALLPKEKDAQALRRIEGVLEELTGAAHTRLLAAEFGSREQAVRSWCLRRAARFPDAGLRAAAERALTAAEERARKPEAGPDADGELYAAALCALSTGSLAGLQPVARRAQADWGKVGAEVRAAAEGARGAAATQALAPLLGDPATARKLTGLRLLGALGERESAPALVRPFLDSEDNSLRVGAINALRGIVDGEPPIEQLAVFDAIELAKRWKERL